MAGAAEDLCPLLWQRDTQLRGQYGATRRDELLVRCHLVFFGFLNIPNEPFVFSAQNLNAKSDRD